MRNHFLKYALLAVVLLYSSNKSHGQARIQDFFPKFNDKIDAALFACNEKDRATGIGACEIELLNPKSLQITNHTPSPAMGGVIIKLLLDSSLNVVKISYGEWADVIGDYDRVFSVESPSVILNGNPFKKGIAGLEGRYNFIIKTVYNPREKLASQGEEPSSGYRLFHGRFECN